MARSAVLPKTNELGFFEMRFESVGGLGANLAGQILTQAMVLGQGFNGAHFSSYGSEKKGSPVKSFVRLCASDKEVRSSAPVGRPDLLAIFHYCLLRVEGTTYGLYPDSTVVVGTPDPIDKVREKLKLASGTLVVVNALDIAVQEKSRLNTAMLGAIVRAAGFIDSEPVKQVIADSFGAKYPQLVEANLKTFDRGYKEAEIKHYDYDGRFELSPFSRYVPALGYENAPIGGVIPNPGNTARKDLSASRQGIFPLYYRDRCIDCGLCTQTCPDFVFVWEKGKDAAGLPAMVLKGPNYQYCKGCLKCVDICPVDALVMECERPEFNFTANPQLWGPVEALVALSRENDPAKWEQSDGSYWRRVS